MEADKELSCASWCTVSTRANVFPILFSERSAPFGNEACACSFCPSHGSHQCFKYKQRCVSLSVWNSHAAFHWNLFWAIQCPEPAVNWQHKPEAEVLKWIPCFCTAVALPESSMGNQGIWKLLFPFWGRRRSTNSRVWTVYPFWGCNSWCCMVKIAGERLITVLTLCSYPQLQSKWNTQTTDAEHLMHFVLNFGLCTQMCQTDGSRAQVWH